MSKSSTKANEEEVPPAPRVEEIMAYSFDKWTNLTHLYTGRYGAVFRAKDADGQPVVLKFSRITNEVGAVELREAYLLTQNKEGHISVPYMIPLQSVTFTSDHKFVILSVEEYTTNAAYLMDDPRLTMSIKCAMAKQMARAICKMFAGLHAAGWLYRDLKLHHILFRPVAVGKTEWRMAICDYGLASPISSEQKSEDIVSRFPVTYWCFAPELTNASPAPITYAVDFWSLGYVLLEFWIGSTTSLGTTTTSANEIRAKIQDIMEDMHKHEQHDMAHFVAWCLEWSPSKRCSSSADALSHPWLREDNDTKMEKTAPSPQIVRSSGRRIPIKFARLLLLLFPHYAPITHHRIYSAFRCQIRSNSLSLFTVFAHVYVKLFYHAGMHSVMDRLKCMLHVRNNGDEDMHYETEPMLSLDRYLDFEIRIMEICLKNKQLI